MLGRWLACTPVAPGVLARPAARALRGFSASTAPASNVGAAPILVPEGTTLALTAKPVDALARLRMDVEKRRHGKPKIYLTQKLTVAGPKGTLSLDLADFVRIEQDGGTVRVSVEDPTAKHQRAVWGLARSLVNNGVGGVTEGHLTIVKFVGTGFRAILEDAPTGGEQLSLRVGYNRPRIVPVPTDLQVTVPVPHRVVIEGVDKQRVGELAALIRSHRKPEPYKGKGIFVNDETIRLKQKKVK